MTVDVVCETDYLTTLSDEPADILDSLTPLSDEPADILDSLTPLSTRLILQSAYHSSQTEL